MATSILPIFTYLMNWIFYLGPLPPRLELWSIVLGAVVQWCSGALTEPYQRKHTMIKYFKMEIILHVLFLCRNSASQDYLKSLAK